MYNEYFGFKEAPFSIAPDPRYLYMTAQHREALAHLVYGLNSDGGCILLTGEVGTGKTTICRCLLEQIPDQANVALLLNPKVSEIELLETLCDELNISYPDNNNSLKIYTDRIYQFLIESNRKNEKTVLIIDEAQNLSSKVLEQLRLLTNLETNQRKLLQIIILGQPELLQILAKTEMRQLAQRITARFHLQPLTKNEVQAYVSHRLAIAGQNIKLFPDNSIKLLYKLSNGIPRLINILCDRALLGAYVENQYAVHPPILKKAAKEVFGELKNVENRHKFKRFLLPGFSLTSVFALSTLFFAALFIYQNLTTNNDMPAKSVSIISSQEPPVRAELQLLPTEARDENATQDISKAYIDLAQTGINLKENSAGATETEEEPTQTENKYTDIDDILNNENNTITTAYQELFIRWQQKYNSKISSTACKQAKSFSLSCLHKQGNINSLKSHNRPAVLTLTNKNGKLRYITVVSIDDDDATFTSAGIEYKIKLSELNKYWYGQFVLLWQKPENYFSVISPGDKGYIVNW